MTTRAVEALRSCEAVYAEDTRVTGRLLSALSISKPLERLDEERITRGLPALMERVRDGAVVCYCSDAGMPGVSDPGSRLVDAFRDAELPVEILPGPTAVATAYVASGFNTPGFLFGGFFPRKEGRRRRLLERCADLPVALILYESPRRLVSALGLIAQELPQRRVAVCRELTKLHEEVVRGRASELCALYKQREAAGLLKGEIVIVIDGPSADGGDGAKEQRIDAARERLRAPELEGMSTRDKAALLREEFGIPRNLAYELASAPVKPVANSADSDPSED